MEHAVKSGSKKRPDQSKISLAPLTFEEALKGLLATPPPPKEPKPKKDGTKVKDAATTIEPGFTYQGADGTFYQAARRDKTYVVARGKLEGTQIRWIFEIMEESYGTYEEADAEARRRAGR